MTETTTTTTELTDKHPRTPDGWKRAAAKTVAHKLMLWGFGGLAFAIVAANPTVKLALGVAGVVGLLIWAVARWA